MRVIATALLLAPGAAGDSSRISRQTGQASIPGGRPGAGRAPLGQGPLEAGPSGAGASREVVAVACYLSRRPSGGRSDTLMRWPELTLVLLAGITSAWPAGPWCASAASQL